MEEKSHSNTNILHRPTAFKQRRFIELLERWRCLLDLSVPAWCQIIELTPQEYAATLSGNSEFPLTALMSLAEHFDVSLENLMNYQVDFRAIAERYKGNRTFLPERYSVAAFGKRRSSKHLLQYLEIFFGKEMKARVLRKFQLDDAIFWDQDAEISVLFLSDLCQYLSELGFSDDALFSMGSYSWFVNKDGPVAQKLGALGGARELHEQFFDQLVGRYFDQNWDYRLHKLTGNTCVVDLSQKEELSDLLKSRNIGNEKMCMAKGGTAASINCYQGLPPAHVRHTACIHRGDSVCRYEIMYS